MRFEWDINKEKINIQKHGVDFEQASFVFADKFALSRFDDEHSGEEDRWLILGKSSSMVLLLVVHTFRDTDGMEFVRIISARRATSNEKEAYRKRCP